MTVIFVIADGPLCNRLQNDGEYVGGCVAGGRRYLRNNANGDAIHVYSFTIPDLIIREKTLLDAVSIICGIS